MALECACLPKQAEKSLIKGEARGEPSFPFKTTTLAEKLNFDLIFSSPTHSEDRFFAVYCRPNETPTNRVGVSVAKKDVSKATKRNKIKRLIKNSFLSKFKHQKGIDVVVRVKHQASHPANDKILLESLTKHWNKIMDDPRKKDRKNG